MLLFSFLVHLIWSRIEYRLAYVSSTWKLLAIWNLLQREHHQGMWRGSWNSKIHINQVTWQTFVLAIAASICESLFYFCLKNLTNKYLTSLVLLLLERFLTWILKALDTKGMSSSAMTSNFLKILFLIMKVVAESETLQHPDFLHWYMLQSSAHFFPRWRGR